MSNLNEEPLTQECVDDILHELDVNTSSLVDINLNHANAESAVTSEDSQWQGDQQNAEETSDVSTDTPATPLIPKNSPTILMDDSTSRFSGALWYEEIKKTRVILAGIGGIGSNVAFQLARLDLERLMLYDPDVVESANMSGQLFSRDDIGSKKVHAICDMITRYTNTGGIFAREQEFTTTEPAGDIMICGFDNMRARKMFYNAWKRHVIQKKMPERKRCLYVDGRLSIDTYQVFVITGVDDFYMKRYEEEFLFGDNEADPTICSLKQTTYMACMIAAYIVNMFVNFVANTCNPAIPYSLPFFTQYDSQNGLFITEA